MTSELAAPNVPSVTILAAGIQKLKLQNGGAHGMRRHGNTNTSRASSPSSRARAVFFILFVLFACAGSLSHSFFFMTPSPACCAVQRAGRFFFFFQIRCACSAARSLRVWMYAICNHAFCKHCSRAACATMQKNELHSQHKISLVSFYCPRFRKSTFSSNVVRYRLRRLTEVINRRLTYTCSWSLNNTKVLGKVKNLKNTGIKNRT